MRSALIAILFPIMACAQWHLDFDEDFSSASTSRDPYLNAWFKLDGNALDSSGNGYSASWFGVEAYTNNSKTGLQAGKFNGASRVFRNSDFCPSHSVTITAWVHAYSFGTRAIVGAGFLAGSPTIGYGLLHTATLVDAQTRNGATSADASVSHGSFQGWVHHAMVRNATSVLLYTNGILAASGATSLTNAPNQQFGIGQRYSPESGVTNWGLGFLGAIGDVRVYSRALSSNDVMRIKNGMAPLHD